MGFLSVYYYICLQICIYILIYFKINLSQKQSRDFQGWKELVFILCLSYFCLILFWLCWNIVSNREFFFTLWFFRVKLDFRFLERRRGRSIRLVWFCLCMQLFLRVKIDVGESWLFVFVVVFVFYFMFQGLVVILFFKNRGQ